MHDRLGVRVERRRRALLPTVAILLVVGVAAALIGLGPDIGPGLVGAGGTSAGRADAPRLLQAGMDAAPLTSTGETTSAQDLASNATDDEAARQAAAQDATSATGQAAQDEAAGNAAGQAEAQAGEPSGAPASPAAEAWPRVLTQTLEVSERGSYTVTLTYGEDAGIPHDAELVVSVPEEDEGVRGQRVARLRELLKLREDEQLLSSEVVRVSLRANGAEPQPAAPVVVDIQTDLVDPLVSDALEIVPLQGGSGAGGGLAQENLTGRGEDGSETDKPGQTHVTLTTSTLGELGMGVVAQPKSSWDNRGASLTVLGPRSVDVVVHDEQSDAEVIEGRKIVQCFGMDVAPAHAWPTTLWLTATGVEFKAGRGGMLGYAIRTNDPIRLLFDQASTPQPVAIPSDGAFALVWESGYRETELDLGAVRLQGLMPVGVEATADDVTQDYADGSALASQTGEGGAQTTLAAYDLRIAAGEATWQPDETHAVEATVTNDAIRADADLRLWHVGGNGTAQAVDAKAVEDGSVSFDLGATGTYVVTVQTGAATGKAATRSRQVRAKAQSTAALAEADSQDALAKQLVGLEGNWATWQLTVNPSGKTLNGGEKLTLTDCFTKNQSIDYASISVTAGVTYDYRGRTGTFSIPDATAATIRYRTRIAIDIIGEEVNFGNEATLTGANDKTIQAASVRETRTIYPSASDVASTSGTNMLRLLVYGDANMQQGIAGAQFILLDANQRPLTFRKGENAGQPVTFVTDESGCANVQLDDEGGGVSIQKNTAYHLEMMRVPEGYRKDSTLYGFMITDNPNYESGDVRKYFNGDTIKVRLHAEEPGLNVSVRFSGNHNLTAEQQSGIQVILQRKTDEGTWEELERHPYTDFVDGTLTFAQGAASTPFQAGKTYRVVQEGQQPWNLGGETHLSTTQYLIVGSGESQQGTGPIEFSVTSDDVAKSFNLVINDEYEDYKLTLTKIDAESGTKLAGAQFEVRAAKDDSAVVKTYTSDENGIVEVVGGTPFVADTLYYIKETQPPTDHLLPLQAERTYFYFCDDSELIPETLKDLPEGETAVNLSQTYESKSLANQGKTRSVWVVKTWQGNTWPSEVARVVVGLYASVDGETPTPVTQGNGTPRTAELTSKAPFNNTAFAGLPTRDDKNREISYSIKEEHVYNTGGTDVLGNYVQEYGVSDSGVYVVRNREATTLTVRKEWYDRTSGKKVTDQELLGQQSSVTFDVYRATQTPSASTDAITRAAMEGFVQNLVKVRSDVTFGSADNWEKVVYDLPKKDDAGNPYHYYPLEGIPSFGDETYVVNEAAGTATIRNKVAPPTALLTVNKAALVNDPRKESKNRDFEFTLSLRQGTRALRGYAIAVGDGGEPLTTNGDGEVSFTLKPKQSLALYLPVGATATVTETPSQEYVAQAASAGATDLNGEGHVFSYVVGSDPVTVTYTNTLRVFCKVVDVNGVAHPFESFKSALAYVRANTDNVTVDGPVIIQMLEDYAMPATDVFDVREDERFVLTTAATDATDGFPFKPSAGETDVAVVTRASGGESLLANAGTLTLQKLCLDGAKDQFAPAINGGLVHSTGTLDLGERVTLRNSAVQGVGGAVYAEGTVNLSAATITDNQAPDGSAIYLAQGATLNLTGGRVERNTVTQSEAGEAGAISVNGITSRVNVFGAPVVYGNHTTAQQAANLYVNADSDYVVNVVDPGLGEGAHVGVTPMAGHREIGEQFANAEVGYTNNLGRFVNDLYGYHGKLKDGTSTNVVWDGMTLTVKKQVKSLGANPNDGFTITLSSSEIKKSTYLIEGTLDYVVTRATDKQPGTIVLRNVRHDGEIRIAPLPTGSYTIEEASSPYRPAFAGTNDETTEAFAVADDGAFVLAGDSTVTVTNTRRMTQVQFGKSLQDGLAGSAAVSFPFAITLTEPDGTPVKSFALAEGIATDAQGLARLEMSPSNGGSATQALQVPVGATMRLAEEENASYSVTATAVTAPQAEGAVVQPIADEDAGSDYVFAFVVTDDGANVTFSNERKLAQIELRKNLENKVAQEETFSYALTLTQDGQPAANYVLRDATSDDAGDEIRTDANGAANVSLALQRDEATKAVTLSVPVGTTLAVEETAVKKGVGGEQQEIYDTTYVVNDDAAKLGTKVTLDAVAESDRRIVFGNVRKTHEVKVTNNVAGYSGNTTPFTFTAMVTDGAGGEESDYDAHGFIDGRRVFELAKGQSETLTVPYGATLTVSETFVVGYETLVQRGSNPAQVATSNEFQVAADETLVFTNNQLINLVLVNNSSHDLADVQVYTQHGSKMYRVNQERTGQVPVEMTNHWAKVSVPAGETAILEVDHQYTETYAQAYTVKGQTPVEGYYYTITNEPSYHEFADPAFLRVYNQGAFEVKGKLRYSRSDSTVSFDEQPLVSFDVNGGAWTTEMEGYHDRDGDRLVYQWAVDSNTVVPQPTDPIYPTQEDISFLGWTADKAFAVETHTTEVDKSKLYDFGTRVTSPITLYAVWAKDARAYRVVTVRNGCEAGQFVSVSLANESGQPIATHTLFDATTTNTDGTASFNLGQNAAKNLSVPVHARLVVQASEDVLATSSEFTDADTADKSLTVAKVARDGTITLTPGICKITDDTGAVLFDAAGKPAVYTTLEAAFTAYDDGALYANAEHTEPATPAAVKMLIDEYAIAKKHAFPTKDVLLTTAGKGDARFPYAGTRTRSTLYRAASYKNGSLFTHQRSANSVTLADIVLDGKSVATEKNINGNLVCVGYDGATLAISKGATLRNVVFGAYNDGNWGRGGAVYITAGSLDVTAGLFSNLHARRGGAICAEGSATLRVSDACGTTRFEDCYAEADDGGAIYHGSSANLVVNGGTNREAPGVVLANCVAKSQDGDGGGIYASSAVEVSVSGCAFTECSARDTKGGETTGFGGGAIGAKNTKSVSVTASSFVSCDSMRGGGALMAYIQKNERVELKNCTFDQCNCMAQGGAVAVYQDRTGDTDSTTTLRIDGCAFDNCSSGTSNGSGGAIQSYLPCVDFANTTFTDCWAGKEGGAVNNWYGANDAAMWPNAYMKVSGCKFVRCRAEDRYDLSGRVHFGGGIATKARTLLVQGSSFEDCVSTLKQGGAIHCSGIGDGSSATVEESTFTGCVAKDNGGAVMASNESLSISDSKFFGCSSFAESGGAVYHGNSINSMAQLTTTIKDCTFSAGPNASDSESCSAAKNGGAVWSRAKSASITGCTIEGCVAAGNGGALYFDNGAGTTRRVVSGNTTISGCQAANGSAVFQAGDVIYAEVTIHDNEATLSRGGAIARSGGSMCFEGSPEVKGNRCSEDDVEHNVVLAYDNNTYIKTTAVGLTADASIGVYVTDDTNAYAKHGTEGLPFGTYETTGKGSDYLECFVSDRDAGLFGYRVSPSDAKIYWGRYLCKITDAAGRTLKRSNGVDAVYQRLSVAFDEFTQVTDEAGETGKARCVKLLVEAYDLFQTGQIENFPAADLTLTTAGADDAQHPYRGTPGTACTISRTNSTNQLFKLNNASATLRLENITLDGRRDKATTTGSYRLLEVANGQLVVNGGTTMRYGRPSGDVKGGAIYAGANAQVLVDSSGGGEVRFEHCYAKWGGGAIGADTGVSICGTHAADHSHGHVSFEDCSSDRGGAVIVNVNKAGKDLVVAGATFADCHSFNEGGALFHNNNDNTTARCKVTNCAFANCYAEGSERYSYGGALCSKAASLTVDSCDFVGCHAQSSGGVINHGAENGDRLQTKVGNSTFHDCRTEGTNLTYGFGGTLYTQAKDVELSGCAVSASTAYNHGGALYCQSGNASSRVRVVDTSFADCSVTRADGRGGAICTRGKSLSVAGASVIDGCTAPAMSGAIHMDTDDNNANKNLVLTVSDSLRVSSCYAAQGGALYLKANVTMRLSGSPEFTQNGYTTSGSSATAGACIYLSQDARLTLEGSPRFSRNVITTERVTNGGITDFKRQDVYLAGYENKSVASLHVTGTLTGDTIWVWPEKSPHRLHGQQFATTEAGIDATSLSCFRNALADGTTNCSNGEYLAGVRHAGDATNVYWDKMYDVTFRKIDNKGVMVPDAEFTLYTDAACTRQLATAVSADGETNTDSQGELLDKGVVDFTTVPIGIYYMRETRVPTSFKPNDATYLLLVGSPALSPSETYQSVWDNGGPLDFQGAENGVVQRTTGVGKYYGIFALRASGADKGKADLSANLSGTNVGIVNVRSDFEAYFMKVDEDGTALPNAEFTLYAVKQDALGEPQTFDNHYPKLELWSRDGENYPDPVPSADGTTKYKMLGGKTVPKGLVYFRELPIGTYYLLETAYPVRDGNNRRHFYVEEDRVFQLQVSGDAGFVLREWQEDGTYRECEKAGDYYVVGNEEAVCKLTDANDRLLFERGHDGTTLLPAIYATLEQGFDSAQTHELYDKDGERVAAQGSDPALDPALKLKSLRDASMTRPVTYDSPRALTLTTAEKTARSDDRYIFVTTRTSDTSRAEVSRAYDEDTASSANAGALLTLAQGARLTLQNINLDGHKDTYNGRAVHVTQGSSLDVSNDVRIHDFKQEATAASKDENDVKGGAVLLDDNTTLVVDGGAYARSAVFERNEVHNLRGEDAAKHGADGGAIAVGKECTVSLTNAQLVGNVAHSSAEGAGNGGAISLNKTRDAQAQAELPLKNVVFRDNGASYNGGAIRTAENCYLTVENCVFTGNRANTASSASRPGEGGAIAVLSKEDGPSELVVVGGSFVGNAAAGGTGGAVKIGGFGSLRLEGVSMSGNAAERGAAVYAAAAATVSIEDGSITGNKVGAADGGAISVARNTSRIYLGGSPVVYDNVSADNDAEQRNIAFVLGDDDNEVIRTTEAGLTGGKLGVFVMDGPERALYKAHGRGGKPFGTFASAANLNVFLNDRNAELYGVRNAKDDSDTRIYWVNLGVPVTFRKVDGYGVKLAGAAFGLYEDAACTQAADVEQAEATSDADGNVRFELVPDGVYYLRETKVPRGYANALTKDAAGRPVANTYVLLVGEEGFEGVGSDGVLSGIGTRDLQAQREVAGEEEPRGYALFLVDAASGAATATPDIARCGVMNVSDGEHFTILRKVDERGTSLAGATFDILRWDRTVVASGVRSGEGGGAFWMGSLPNGTYYLHETQAPDGYEAGWYQVRVSDDGVSAPARLASAP